MFFDELLFDELRIFQSADDSSMVLQQIKTNVENSKQQISGVQGAITALKNWEVEFNTYLASLDAQMKQIQHDTDAIRAKEESLDSELNIEKMRQTDMEQETVRDTQVRVCRRGLIVFCFAFCSAICWRLNNRLGNS